MERREEIKVFTPGQWQTMAELTGCEVVCVFCERAGHREKLKLNSELLEEKRQNLVVK